MSCIHFFDFLYFKRSVLWIRIEVVTLYFHFELVLNYQVNAFYIIHFFLLTLTSLNNRNIKDMMNKKDNSGTGEKNKSKEFIDSSDDSSDDDNKKEEKKKSKSSSSKKDSTEQTKKEDKAKSESESDGSDSDADGGDAEEVCNFKLFIYNIYLIMCCHVHCVFLSLLFINWFLFHLKLIKCFSTIDDIAFKKKQMHSGRRRLLREAIGFVIFTT